MSFCARCTRPKRTGQNYLLVNYLCCSECDAHITQAHGCFLDLILAQCALAHILPGEPLANDRKNKRAQQLAQREAAQRENAEREGLPAAYGGVDEESPRLGSAIAPGPHSSIATLQQQFSGLDSQMTIGSRAAGATISTEQQSPPSATSGRAPSSPPMTRPVVPDHGGRRSSQGSFQSGSPVFSSSPFSPPGRAPVFFSGSLGSDEGMSDGAIAHSAARRHASPMRKNGLANGQALWTAGSDNESEEEAVYTGLGESRYEEDCLPSSLSDLMTPEEIHRRQRNMQPARPALQDGGLSLSRSVPHSALLQSPSHSYTSSLSQTAENLQQPRLSRSPPAFGPAPMPARMLPSNHPPGSSLPPGLAAGLSNIHLQAPRYTGETPPPSQGASPVLAPVHSKSGPIVGSPLARNHWQRAHASKGEEGTTLKESVPSNFDGEEMPFELEV